MRALAAPRGTAIATLAFGLVVFGGWELALALASVPDYILPAPSEIVRAAVDEHGRLVDALGTTAIGAFGGFVVGNLAGVAAAVAITASQTAARVIQPIAVGIRAVPIIALTPFLTLLLGRGLVTVTTIAALIVFFPTLVNGVLGFRSVAPSALELMSVINASRPQVFWHVRFPAALPYLFSAFRVAAPSSVLGAMVAEWVASGEGLGYLILQAGVSFDVALMWSAVLLSTALAALAFTATARAERVLVPWQPLG